MQACSAAYGKERVFTSLVSKALWLCYPERIPIFDDYVHCALNVISKLEEDLNCLPNSDPEYRKFIYVWLALYKRYENVVDGIDTKGYPYRVRIFDKILWLLGEPRYGPRTDLADHALSATTIRKAETEVT